MYDLHNINFIAWIFYEIYCKNEKKNKLNLPHALSGADGYTDVWNAQLTSHLCKLN
jgi:hypothetical protein